MSSVEADVEGLEVAVKIQLIWIGESIDARGARDAMKPHFPARHTSSRQSGATLYPCTHALSASSSNQMHSSGIAASHLGTVVRAVSSPLPSPSSLGDKIAWAQPGRSGSFYIHKSERILFYERRGRSTAKYCRKLRTVMNAFKIRHLTWCIRPYMVSFPAA